MDPLFGVNGLMFWTGREIRLRRQFEDHFDHTFEQILLETNPAWRMVQVEAPLLTPRNLLNVNYTDSDIWNQGLPVEDYEPEFLAWAKEKENIEAVKDQLDPYYDDYEVGQETEYDALLDVCKRGNSVNQPVYEHAFRAWARIFNKGELALRPETTPGSYVYARHLLDTHSGVKPPFCVWQVGKSFRREQDQVTKNMRLKEFYQQEFQCVYTADTMNDYHAVVLEPVRKMIGEMIGLPTRIVESDRLPSYSETTMDVEAWIEELPEGFMPTFAEPNRVGNLSLGRWMEVCSISRRTDFPGKARFQTKKGVVEKDLLVLEVAIGLDRCVYCFQRKEV